MTILCIDTATDHGTAAVVRDDGAAASVSWRSADRHGENLFGHIESALSKAGAVREELSLIGVNVGPGKFTSLRVGLSTAKGLAFGLGLPIVGVSSLRVLARAIGGEPGTIGVPVMNAYRGDVFAAAYTIGDGALLELVAPFFGSPKHVFDQLRRAIGDRRVAVGGEGIRAHAAVIEAQLGGSHGVMEIPGEASIAEALIAEVRYVMHAEGPDDLDSLEPQYLRPSDAKLPVQPPPRERPS